MKFLVSGKLDNNRLLQAILAFTLAYLMLLWITGTLLYADKIGFTYSSVEGYYLGSESEFKNPISYTGLLEVTHFHLFTFGMALLLLNHLALTSTLIHKAKPALILVSFISGIGNVGAGWLVRFVSPIFVYLKIGSFIIFQSCFFILICCSFAAIKRYRKR